MPVDRRLSSQIADRCCYGSCPEDQIADSDYCAEHDESERQRKRSSTAARRLKFARAGQCRDGCGRKVRKRYVKGRIVPRRCSSCAKADNKRRTERRKSRPGDNSKAPEATRLARGFTALDKSDKREGRGAVERYVGRDRRGAPSIADRDEDLRSAIDDAIAILTQIRDKGIALVRSPAVTELGTIARAEAHRELAYRWLRVRGICEQGAESFSRGSVAEVDALRRDTER
jgi:hypothetical protein